VGGGARGNERATSVHPTQAEAASIAMPCLELWLFDRYGNRVIEPEIGSYTLLR